MCVDTADIANGIPFKDYDITNDVNIREATILADEHREVDNAIDKKIIHDDKKSTESGPNTLLTRTNNSTL